MEQAVEDVVQYNPEMVVTTLACCGKGLSTTSKRFVFLQATGKGELQVEAFDERGICLLHNF